MSLPATTRPDHRPYQGFPYIQPPVNDVPSLSKEEVAERQKYQDLPRRQLGRQGANAEYVSDAVPSSSKQDDGELPVVYIDLPEEDAGSSSNASKEDIERPVVYIDIPDSNGSGVSERLRQDDDEPAFVQETIFYDPFKDRHINVRETESIQNAAGPSRPNPPPRPNPPSSLSIQSPGSSQSSYTPSFLSKESYIYGSPQTSTANDDFALSPLDVNEFPRPPPAYEEIDSQSQVRAPQTEPEPPRTQVIIPSTTTPTVVYDETTPIRKLVACQHCNSTVQTIITIRTGLYTHLLGIFFLFVFCPLIFFVYTSDSCKYKDHYCPYCSKIIAQEPPAVCGCDVTYVS